MLWDHAAFGLVMSGNKAALSWNQSGHMMSSGFSDKAVQIDSFMRFHACWWL